MILTWLKKVYRAALNVIYPRHCVVCGRLGAYLYADCLIRLPVKANYWEEDFLTLFDYGQPVAKKLIWLLKYRGVRDLAPLLADLLYEHIIEDLAEAELFSPAAGRILIIPVPLSPKRFRSRGFNQAEEIAKHLAGRDDGLFRLESGNLVKIRETATQVSAKSRRVRLDNLAGAFSVKNQARLEGKTIILLDDVATTGTTLEEAAKALRRGRPRKIYKLVVARG